MDENQIYKQFLELIKDNLNNVSYNTWFSNSNIVSIDSSKMVISVPGEMYKNHIMRNYHDIIVDSLYKITGDMLDIEVILEEELNSLNLLNPNLVEEIAVQKVDNFESNLIKQYTFDNYMMGDTNRFAKTSAQTVALAPGKTYNPLFIYGRSGLGKTHLMHAIGNYIVENSSLRVLYTSSDEFRNDYTGLANLKPYENTLDYINNFKKKYRDIDVLIIDDIQYLVGAEKTQEEFFHTFNELHRANKQIIISSDRSPDDLKLLQDRLRSRFTWGLPVDIYPPDFELKCLIIKDKLKHYTFGDRMSEDAIEYVANNCDGDVRKLEGIINRLSAMVAINVPDKITLELAIDYTKDYLPKNFYKNNHISNIQKAVSDHYKITVEMMKSRKRSNNIAYPRQIAMYLCRVLTDESFPKIGLEFGNRDHSTVIHACDKIESDMKSNSQLKNIIEEIKDVL